MIWRVTRERGSIRLPEAGWWLDAHFPTDRSFVSHAHFDHLAGHRQVLLTETTARLMRARMPGKRQEIALPFHQPWEDGDGTRFTLVPAGHVFGSAQLLAENHRGSLLYTGDFKLRPGKSAEPCETPRADVLIMETTYGKPQYRMPPVAQVLEDIRHFCRQALEDGKVPVLFGYSLGKSQEVLSGLTEAGLPVMLHPQVWKMTKLYESLGIRFPPHREFKAEEAAGHIVIAPPQSSQSPWLKRLGDRRTAMLSGWAIDPGSRHRSSCDAAFPLSDHADYNDLLEFVRRVGPKLVHTVHGFASEFASDLRRMGIEAWALGEDRQLEIRLSLDDPEPAPKAEVGAEDSEGAIQTFGQLSRMALRLSATPGRIDRVTLLSDFLKSLPEAEAGLACLHLGGRAFPPSSGLRTETGWSLVRRVLEEIAGPAWARRRRTARQISDAGEAAEDALASSDSRGPLRSRSLPEIDGLLRQLAQAGGPTRRLELLRSAFSDLPPGEARQFVRLLTGDVRSGVGEGAVEEAIAQATGNTPAEIRAAHLLCGDLKEVWLQAKAGRLKDLRPVVHHPLQFMLASPEPDGEAIVRRMGEQVWVEDKLDGVRCQLHVGGGRAELFSRDLRRLTPSFPELAGAASRLSDGLIADGEILAWDGRSILPFVTLQTLLQRRQDGMEDLFLGPRPTAVLRLFDLLMVRGTSLLEQPLSERRRLLEQLDLACCQERISVAPRRIIQGAAAIEVEFAAARARGNEGLMIKDPGSLYSPGKRGFAWIKLKKARATLDVVVVAVEYGHGRRSGVLSDYTFAVRGESGELLTLGKAYTGLTDREIAELTLHFLDRVVEKSGKVLRVLPDIVLEVAFDSLRASSRHDSGYALRFPRIVRRRTDKAVEDIDTLDTCRRLAEATRGDGSGAVGHGDT